MFCTHSKYETVTPPALQRKSGMSKTLFLNRMSSASGVVGPFAASAMIFALIRDAFFVVITFSSAAGTRISHCSSSKASLVMGFVPGNPTTLPVFCLC